VTPAGRSRAHVYVEHGQIASVSTKRQPASHRVDAGGLLVMPGMVDVHVHLMDPAETHREDFPTGTAAAACAGVTTIIEHTHAGPVRTRHDLEDKQAYLSDRSFVDFGLAAHAWPSQLDDMVDLWRAGAAFFKVFTCATHGLPAFDAAQLLELFQHTAAIGAVCLVHCEDESITAQAEQELRRQGRDDPGVVPEWRNREAELVAVAVVAETARLTRARVVIAHASHTDVTRLVARARQAGADTVVETCPQYLSFREEEIRALGALRKFTPPARARGDADLDAMWAALADGQIDYIASDHAPSTQAHKRAGSIWDVPFGLPGLDTTLAVLLDGARRGRISYERIAEAYAETPARIYGLYPAKGTLRAGADADIILVDPNARWTVSDEDVLSKASWSPFAGHVLAGRPLKTFLRGSLLAQDGKVTPSNPGTGRFLHGAGVREGAA
jgi:dihydroorotase (multifunctional complex type)